MSHLPTARSPRPHPLTWRTLLALALHLALAACLMGLAAWPAGAQAPSNALELRVGSKRFTESYILAELIAQTAQAGGAKTQVRQGLGNSHRVRGAALGPD